MGRYNELNKGIMSQDESQKGDRINRQLALALLVLGCAMALYHLVSVRVVLQSAIEHYNTHLGFALVLVFLGSLYEAKRKFFKPILFIFLLASIFATAYVKVNFLRLEAMPGFANDLDMVVGIILIILVLESTREAWGPVVPMVTLIAILYMIFCDHFTGWLRAAPLQPEYIVSMLSVSLIGGIYMMLNVSADMIFLFMVFGSLLLVGAAVSFFIQVGNAAGRLLAGGPGHTAVVSSAMIGMVTGTVVGNVAMTGAFTIPLMKKAGYEPKVAASVEATASCIGQLAPPIMGTSAFLMANLLAIPYARVMLAGIIPASCYFIAAAVAVQVIAVKTGVKRVPLPVDMKLMLKDGPAFVVPLLTIIALLIIGFTPMYAAFWAIVAVLVIMFLRGKEARPSLGTLLRGFSKGALMGAKLAVILACVGMIAQALISTGLGIKFTSMVETISQGQLYLVLLLAMVASLILGMGMTTMACYLMVVLVTAPVLITMGVEPIAAHFFAFYFGIMSNLTPPVALGALAGSTIAGSKYFETALFAFRMAIPGYILAWLLIFNPGMLLAPQEPVSLTLTLVLVPVIVVSISTALYGCFLTTTSLIERILFGFAGVVALAYGFTHITTLFIVAVAMFLPLLLWQFKQSRRRKMNTQGIE